MKGGLVLLIAVAVLLNPLLAGQLEACSDSSKHPCCPNDEASEKGCHANLPDGAKKDTDSSEERGGSEGMGCILCNAIPPATDSKNPLSIGEAFGSTPTWATVAPWRHPYNLTDMQVPQLSRQGAWAPPLLLKEDLPILYSHLLL